MEHIFTCHEYAEDQKVKMAAMEFTHYALTWWSKFQRERRHYGDPEVATWDEMKRIMRKRYVPASYERDLKLELQMLTQGSRSVDDYYKRMEYLMTRANVNEEEEVTMARFIGGLRVEIRDVVELQERVDKSDLLHKATQVEKQLRRRSPYRRNNSGSLSPSWRSPRSSESPPKERKASKGKEVPKEKAREVKCFKCLGRGHYAHQCPNKRTILLKGGEYSSASEGEEERKGSNKGGSSSVVHEPIEGDLLMMRRLLGNQLVPLNDTQRESIFHTRCSIQGKVCSMIIDSGSCTNVASTRLVSKLNLVTKPHPKPYTLQWLNDNGELRVSQQVDVEFTIGGYKDVVVCDVVPMEACHILLGRPWQYDKEITYEGRTNRISFMHQGKKIVLVPLSPKAVCEDRMRLREKIAQEKREESDLKEKSEASVSKVSEESKSETLECEKSCLITNKLANLGESSSVSTMQVIKEEHPTVIPPSQPTLEVLKLKSQTLPRSDKGKVSNIGLKSIPKSEVTKPLDSRSNPFQGGEYDENPIRKKSAWEKWRDDYWAIQEKLKEGPREGPT